MIEQFYLTHRWDSNRYCSIRQHQCKWVIPTPNECPGYNTKQSDGEIVECRVPFIAIAPRSTLAWSDRTCQVLSMAQIELNCELTTD